MGDRVVRRGSQTLIVHERRRGDYRRPIHDPDQLDDELDAVDATIDDGDFYGDDGREVW